MRQIIAPPLLFLASNALTSNPTSVGRARGRPNATVGGVGVQTFTESQFQDLVAHPEKIPARVEEIWPFGVEAPIVLW